MEQERLFNYLLRLADDRLILGHRLSEWCGHGPILEEDIALTNVALDLVGQARMYYAYAADVEGKGRTEDDLAYLRNERNFVNLLLVERPNGHFGDTLARQFLFDVFHLVQQEQLLKSKDEQIAAIAAKAIKEVKYHVRHSSEWMCRLGDGTDLSHDRIQQSLEDIWRFTGEMFVDDELSNAIASEGIGPAPGTLKAAWHEKVDNVLTEASLSKPQEEWMASGGRSGRHSEHMGYILAELQFMQRAFPDNQW